MNRSIIGEIRVDSGLIVIADPCYHFGIWCSGWLKVLSGTYQCCIERVRSRVSKISIYHKDYPNVRINEETDFEIGVDSGQAGFFEANYHHQYTFVPNLFGTETQEQKEWYNRICAITLNDEIGNAGIIDNLGFVSESGKGDGGYVCNIGRNEDGVIVAADVVFIDEQ